MNCKDKGYEVGQVFERTCDGSFAKGSLIILAHDDNSSHPFFDLLRGHTPHSQNGKVLVQGAYGSLDYIKRIYPPENESNKVEITCEGKTVEISRESAKALNLI